MPVVSRGLFRTDHQVGRERCAADRRVDKPIRTRSSWLGARDERPGTLYGFSRRLPYKAWYHAVMTTPVLLWLAPGSQAPSSAAGPSRTGHPRRDNDD